MAPSTVLSKVLFFLSIISTISTAHLQPTSDGYISVTISEKGIDFVKDLLIEQAVSSLTPLELSPIEKYVHILFVGRVHMVLSNIVIYHIDVPNSDVELSDDGISINASGATANLTMDWKYSYKNWLVEVTDHGNASVQVQDMDVDLSLSLKNKGGNLELSLVDSNCDVEDIDIQLNGGVSWLYQGIVDAFSHHIESAVENAILDKLTKGVSKIGSLLQSLPRAIKVDDASALNVTFVGDHIISESSIDFAINGLFVPTNTALFSQYEHQISQAAVPGCDPAKMLAMSLYEDVFNSLSLVNYNAGLMWWSINKIPTQSLLNTSAWREVVPKLYEEFPDDSMILNISTTAPPYVHISTDEVLSSIYADVTVEVLDNGIAIPVACISLEASGSGAAHISGNNLTGIVKLADFGLSVKWSKVGDLQIDVIEPIISEVLNDVLLPLLNTHLMSGFPLPLIHGFFVQDAKIVYSDSVITVCSDVSYAEDHLLPVGYKITDVFHFPFRWFSHNQS